MLYLLLSTILFSNIEGKLLTYFRENITSTGMVLDRESNKNIVSIAATGFGMYVWAISSLNGDMTKKEAEVKIKTAFKNTLRLNPKKNRGWLTHFLNSDGSPYNTSEVSTIDSAIFYAGALRAAELIDDKEFLTEVKNCINSVDVKWMTKDEYIRHGLYWDGESPKFIDCVWDNLSEGIIIYKLFEIPYTPKDIKYDLSLFVYYYPLCFFDDDLLKENLKKAIKYQQESFNIWGITATDTQENGYQDFHKDTISPLTIITLTTYLSLPKDYSFPAEVVQSKNVLTGWTSSDKIGIDFGACYILNWKARNNN